MPTPLPGRFRVVCRAGRLYAERASQPTATRKTKRVRPTTVPSSKPPRKHKKRGAFGQDVSRIYEMMQGDCGCGLYDLGCFKAVAQADLGHGVYQLILEQRKKRYAGPPAQESAH